LFKLLEQGVLKMQVTTNYQDINECPDTGKYDPDCEHCSMAFCARGKTLMRLREGMHLEWELRQETLLNLEREEDSL